jgi:3',5'-cyclic AMP phosphodiesterase CpdA/CheY-like chemotaxis protein
MKKIKILWAEDKHAIFDLHAKKLKTYLSKAGVSAEILWAAGGDQVYRYLLNGEIKKEPIDLLICDVSMPKWNGIRTINDISTQYKGLPIIVVTALLDRYEKKLHPMRQAGAIRDFFSLYPVETWFESVLKNLRVSPPSIIHMSDIHFGRFHGFKDTSLEIEDIAAPILKEIKDKTEVNLVIISGDLTSEGLDEEFERALSFITFVSDRTGVPLDRFIIVPGNHDIFRREQPHRRFNKYVEFLNSMYKKLDDAGKGALSRYPEVFDDQRIELDPKRHTEDSGYSIAVFDELKTIIIGLNSVVSSDDESFDYSRINPTQLARVSDRLRNLPVNTSDYLRIAVFHHNLFVVPSMLNDGNPERMIRNQGLVLHTLISNDVKLVLHGHTHFSIGYSYRPYLFAPLDPINSGIHVFAAGTLSGSELESGQSYFHLTHIQGLFDDTGKISKGSVTPYKIIPNSLSWTVDDPFEVDLD